MSRFFVEPGNIFEQEIVVDSGDYNHIKNVLRMRIGDALVVCDGCGTEYHCVISEYREDSAVLSINHRQSTEVELPVKLRLYQGLPKRDKMELIVQKAIELGAYEVIPVMCKRTIVKLDDAKKEQKKVQRLQSIAESAAKQCGRGLIPEVTMPMSFKEAVLRAEATGDMILFPYENALGMKATKEALRKAASSDSVAIFIGPEGGFEREEVAFAKEHGANIISLGSRILRTETAGMCLLSMLMLEAELRSEES